jgi:ACR3 family arsenite transporter
MHNLEQPLLPGNKDSTVSKMSVVKTFQIEQSVLTKLSLLNRLLPLWIVLAIIAGLALGRLIPNLNQILNHVAIGGNNVAITIGLLAMMYPVLAKVRYENLSKVITDYSLLIVSLVLNWIVGPLLMFGLAWLFLPDLPAYRTGLILVGLARCIAMVLIWNDLACGDNTIAAVLVAINSLFQIVAYAGLAYFYLKLLPSWLGLSEVLVNVSISSITKSVLIFLGIPLIAGWATRKLGEKSKGQIWYENQFLPKIAPTALYGLLFTVIILFALQGNVITHHPANVVRIALPLLLYFVIMWFGSFAIGRVLKFSYPRIATLAFTAAGNNFELAIAVAIGTFGIASGQALAGVVGPLIEVPVLISLVYLSLWIRTLLNKREEFLYE